MGRKSRIARGLDISAAAKKMMEKALGVALTDEEYFALESEALKSPIERDLEEFAKAYIRELEGTNPPELEGLEEVEVVKPELLARWRTFLPEETIEAILRHREKVIEMRRVEERVRVPDFAYHMPRLRPVEKKPEVFAMGIDTDGWISPRIPRTKRIRVDRVYTYYVEEPRVGFATDSFEVTKKMADMLLAGITPRPQPPPKPPMFGVLVATSRAVRAVYLARPYFVKRENVSKANEILRLYRERSSIPIA